MILLSRTRSRVPLRNLSFRYRLLFERCVRGRQKSKYLSCHERSARLQLK